MNDISLKIEEAIQNKIVELLNKSNGSVPELPVDLVATDNIAEVIEKLVILHIRTWMLEDAIGLAQSDEEIGKLKKKIDICFKQKRPMYIQAINKMIDEAIKHGKSLQEDSVKIYKSF